MIGAKDAVLLGVPGDPVTVPGRPREEPAERFGEGLTIGVLAVQGAVREHMVALRRLGARAVPVVRPGDLEGLDGLIIPGGESTTIGRLMDEFGLTEAVAEFGRQGGAIYGTCAGMILLADEIAGSEQTRLGLMDMVAQRNAFGRQRESFEADLALDGFDRPFRAVFIRAPYIESVGPDCRVLGTVNEKIVAARQGRFLATAFHPELTEDLRVHRLFLEMVREAKRDGRLDDGAPG